MFARAKTKGGASELVNLANAYCVTHRKWHDGDDFAIVACFTSDRSIQGTVFLTGPMGLEETDAVLDVICTAIQDGVTVLDLRPYGEHGHEHSHAVHHARH